MLFPTTLVKAVELVGIGVAAGFVVITFSCKIIYYERISNPGNNPVNVVVLLPAALSTPCQPSPSAVQTCPGPL
jgi:hypothetical protein